MTDTSKDGLKVAYRDAPTEEQIKAILKKRRIARIINTIVFLILMAAAAYFSYKRYQNMQANEADIPSETTTEAPHPIE